MFFSMSYQLISNIYLSKAVLMRVLKIQINKLNIQWLVRQLMDGLSKMIFR